MHKEAVHAEQTEKSPGRTRAYAGRNGGVSWNRNPTVSTLGSRDF
nr:MAG TPA: hypothetical protein [Caudoviricetes sp.]